MSQLLFRMSPGHGRIEGTATNQISEGGNYRIEKPFLRQDSTRGLRWLRGKATSGSSISLVRKKNPDKSFVRFQVDPVTGNSRSELAPGGLFEFGQTLRIDVEFRVRAQDPDRLTGYVLQFWQPIISPIGGVRLSNGQIQLATRTGGSPGSRPLGKGWNRLSLVYRPGPNGTYQAKGDINGQVFGRIDGGSQAGRAVADQYRPKFGWYGSVGQSFSVDYRLFEMGLG